MRSIVAVPARLASSRLPNKVLANIAGKPMIRHVLEACARAKEPVGVVLCTDDVDLACQAQGWGFQVLMTSSACTSGSDRLASVASQLVALVGGDANQVVILNVQGDQPLINPDVIDEMSTIFSTASLPPEVLTPVYPMAAEHVHNPNVVKTLLASNGRAIYFSRSAIPHVRGVEPESWPSHTTYWGHVGIYGYRGDVLLRWPDLPSSPLEESEGLEQLRLIEAGIIVSTFPVVGTFLSVDSFEQLEQARYLMNRSCHKHQSHNLLSLL